MLAQASDGFWQWLSSLPQYKQPDIFMTAIITAAITVVLVVSIISFSVYRTQRNRLNDALKRDMLERGMSAEDIAEIVRAKPAGRCDRRDV